MIFIKIFLISVLTLGLFIFSLSSKVRIFQKISIIAGYVILSFFIVYPQYSDTVAHYFSIGTGKDLILYVVVSLMSLLSIILYVNSENNHKIITKIIRDGAKKNAKKCK